VGRAHDATQCFDAAAKASARRPRAAPAPFPSMMIATCNGGPVDPVRRLRRCGVDMEVQGEQDGSTSEISFPWPQQLIYFGKSSRRSPLHIIGDALDDRPRNLVILLELLDGIQPVAADMRTAPWPLRRIYARPLRVPCGVPTLSSESASEEPVLRWGANRGWNRRSPSPPPDIDLSRLHRGRRARAR